MAQREGCDFLWIGITQHVVEDLKETPIDRHRSEPTNNPLTYYERVVMLKNGMVEAGVDESQFGIIPFPIETPAILKEFLPTRIPIFTTIYDKWNRHKVRLLGKLGYKVIVLWQRTEKEFEGLEVRKMILTGDDGWKSRVPAATIKIAERYDLKTRLRKLQNRKPA